MLRRKFLASMLAVAVVTTGLASGVTARDTYGGWEKLGERKVNRIAERDTIIVGRGDGKYRQIRFYVLENSIHIIQLRVVYGNGSPENIPVRALIPAGGKTRIISLLGGRRSIRRIEMYFQSIRNGRGRATVEVWGRR